MRESENKQESKTDSASPQSLVATEKDHSKRDELISKCFNNTYDALTIFISIADITTDIMVLTSYYIAGRTTFFWISLVILICAQIGYLIVFFLSFDSSDFIDNVFKIFKKICCGCKPCEKFLDKTLNSPNKCLACTSIIIWILFLLTCALIICSCLLPFGHLVAFLMYFGENEKSKFSKWLKVKIGIKKRTNIPLEEHLSEMAKFTIDKINKHGGFILEAFLEALPQSILQLIAMVYFKEANYIAVGSIILSMTSIMTKSLVISQGVEWKSYLFCWLCVCCDFFSIFFVVSWIFLSNEYIYGDFLGHFSIIGQIWCWTVIIAIIPPIVFFAIGYLFIAMWFFAYEVYRNNGDKLWEKILLVVLFFTCGNAAITAGYCIGAVIACLLLSILNFSIVAVFIWLVFTAERWSYTEKKISNILKKLLHFISNASSKNNDRIIRISCINYAYDQYNKLGKYILKRKDDDTLHQLSYKDIRDHCSKPKKANVFRTGFKMYVQLIKDYKEECWDNPSAYRSGYVLYEDRFIGLGCLLLIYISLPIYLLSRIVFIIFPYFIVGYLSYYELWFKMELFELTMLGMYIFLQLIVLILGIFVLRTHLWLWHIIPGQRGYDMRWPDDIDPFLKTLYSFYDSIQWLPIAREMVITKFGQDIGNIVIEYVILMNKINDSEF